MNIFEKQKKLNKNCKRKIMKLFCLNILMPNFVYLDVARMERQKITFDCIF